LINETGDLEALTKAAFVNEDFLQELLEKYPEVISGSQVSPDRPRRWLLVKRAQGVQESETSGSRWSIDHLFLDQDGIPTLVEVKRSTDTRLRREVVGQLLDYAANAVRYWTVETIRSSFEACCQKAGDDAEEVLTEFLQDDEAGDIVFG
jgi:hypothetical protein